MSLKYLRIKCKYKKIILYLFFVFRKQLNMTAMHITLHTLFRYAFLGKQSEIGWWGRAKRIE